MTFFPLAFPPSPWTWLSYKSRFIPCSHARTCCHTALQLIPPIAATGFKPKFLSFHGLSILESRTYELPRNQNTKYSHITFLIDVCKFSATFIYSSAVCCALGTHNHATWLLSEHCVWQYPFFTFSYSLHPQLRVFPFAEQEPTPEQQRRLKSIDANIWHYYQTIIFSRTGLWSAFFFFFSV